METTTSTGGPDTEQVRVPTTDDGAGGADATDTVPVVPTTDTAATPAPTTPPVPADSAGSSGAAEDDSRAPVDPEKEGDVAADYLEELLDIADLDGDIDLDVEGDRAIVSLVGGDLEVLVGPAGSVLEALQDLTRLAVLRSTGHRSRLLLDVDGWRARRREQIRVRATDAVGLARSSGEPVALPPMSAYERKVVHDVVAELGLVSSSDGEDPNRHVVIRTS